MKDEYYEAARAYSRAENVSLSQAVNRLLAIAFQKSHTTEQGETTGSRVRSRFPTSKGAKKVTGVTDAWLAELARREKGRLATMDAGLAMLHRDVAEWVGDD